MTTSMPYLWLVRHAGSAVALIAANDRDRACRLAHELDKDTPYCDFSTLNVGTSRQAKLGVVADLRTTGADDGVVVPRVKMPAKRRRVGHVPGPNAPTAALNAFTALCTLFGVAENVARSSHSPIATRLRWAIWSACIEAGYSQGQTGDVTGHHGGTVSHTMIDIEAGKHKKRIDDPQVARAFRFAATALRAEISGPDEADEASHAAAC